MTSCVSQVHASLATVWSNFSYLCLDVWNKREQLVALKRQFKMSITFKCSFTEVRFDTQLTYLCMSLLLEYLSEVCSCCVPVSVVQLCVGGCVCLPLWDGAWRSAGPTCAHLGRSVVPVCTVQLTCHMTKKMSAAHSTKVSM